jgi:hypothetical protein
MALPTTTPSPGTITAGSPALTTFANNTAAVGVAFANTSRVDASVVVAENADGVAAHGTGRILASTSGTTFSGNTMDLRGGTPSNAGSPTIDGRAGSITVTTRCGDGAHPGGGSARLPQGSHRG